MSEWLEDHKNLSKFEKEFLTELLNDIEKRENSSWAKSWDFIETQNAFSGHKYSGMNDLFLELMSRARKFDDPRFATFNQARKNDYHIEKGSKGLPIQFFSFINKETKKQWNEAAFNEKTKNMTPEEKKQEADKKIAIAKTFHVFNAKNLISNKNKKTLSENVPITKFNKKINTDETIDIFEENLTKNMGVGINEIHSEGAFYTPVFDEVTMPLKEQFNSYEERMATLLHELGHATGHKKRLNRDLTGTFGSSNYSKEEFKVEINSVFMVNTLGLKLTDKQKENHLKYLDSWGKTIKKQPKEFLYSLNDSLKIKDYMLEKGEFKKVFLEKGEKNLTEEFAEAYNNFTNYEYGKTFTVDETLNMIKEEDYILPIAYTEDTDNHEIFTYEKQVSYDLKNKKVINNIKSDFFDFTFEKDLSIEEMTEALNIVDFDTFISQDNMGLDLDEITEVMQVGVIRQKGQSIIDYAEENNFIINYDLPFAKDNLNHILKDVDNNFFKTHNIKKPENFIEDKEFKDLIALQSVHYEEINEIPFGDTYNINFNSNSNSDDKVVKYSNYRDLWEDNFKEKFFDDLKNFTLNDLKYNEFISSPDLIDRLSNNYEEVAINLKNTKNFEKRTKDRDIDGDGIPDRVDAHLGRPEIRERRDLEKEAEKSQARTR